MRRSMARRVSQQRQFLGRGGGVSVMSLARLRGNVDPDNVSETGAIGTKLVQHPDHGGVMHVPIYPNDEAKVVSLSFTEGYFPDRQELASSLVSRFTVDCDKRPLVLMRGADFNGNEWSYLIVATSFIDYGGGINIHGHFEIEGIVVGGYHGIWHLGHRLVASYDYANSNNPKLGHGKTWHFNDELAIYVPIDAARDEVDCPGHPDQAPLGNEPGEHELCTYCQGTGKIKLETALTHDSYSNLRQEKWPSA